jgi:NAD(P)H-quinone oxidoreductase subunit M
MSWIMLAGLSALFESFKDVASKRSLPLIDVYLISWALSALITTQRKGLQYRASCWRIAMLLKSTTRHIHIFTAEVEDNQLVPSETVLTLDVDPDNELEWSEDALQRVYEKFDELVEASSGEDLTDYNLRRIGSDLEHFVRSLLQKGIIGYNLNSRVSNYSMGLPQVAQPK